MNGAIRSRLSKARYALPTLVEPIAPVQSAKQVAAACARLGREGFLTTAGYFGGKATTPAQAAAASLELAQALAGAGWDTLLAVKAPALGFDAATLKALAATGAPLILDALTEPAADRTLELALETGAGIVLPARWRRSARDAHALRDLPNRIRIVKGEWPDPSGDVPDIETAFSELAHCLAGRAGTVGIATHDPALAARVLPRLLEFGTPCELEQLRGLPRRRTMDVARSLGVPVRLYNPHGPGWWPYAIDKALARPYLPAWAVRDYLRL